MSHRWFLLLGLSVGCIQPETTDKGGDDSGGDDSGGGGGSDTTIYDIQTGVVEADSTVTLKGVVVTSELTADGKGFYVAEPEGGEYSGLYVYLQGEFSDLNFYRDDLVNVTGTVTEYYDFTEFTVTSSTAIEVTGELSGGVAPAELTGTEAWAPEDWEPYEGMLISLPDQTVESAIDSYGEARLSAGIDMSDTFYGYSTEFGATYTAVVGLLEYSFSEFKLGPRDDEDLQGYVPGAGPEEASICEIQEGGAYTDMPVLLNNVVVTSALNISRSGFFVQETGGAWCGVYVYLGNALEDDSLWNVTPGDVLSIEGTVTEYGSADDELTLTEISVANIEDVTVAGTTADVTVTALTADTVPTDDAGWEAYEGVLISLPDVEITSDESSYGEVDTNWDIQLDDALYYYDLATGYTFATVTGLVNYSYGLYELFPRSEDDLGGGSGGEGEGEGETVTSVVALQQGVDAGTVSDGDPVALTGVVTTTGMTADGKGFFVQDYGGGAWSGVYVYVGSSGVTVSEGSSVNITGEVSEYYDFTEVDASAGTVDISDTDMVPEVVATPLDAAPSDWEPYEGCLLELSDLSVTSAVDSYGQASTSFGIFLDDLFLTPPVASGDSFSAVTGPLYYSFSEWKLEPESASDYVE